MHVRLRCPPDMFLVMAEQVRAQREAGQGRYANVTHVQLDSSLPPGSAVVEAVPWTAYSDLPD